MSHKPGGANSPQIEEGRGSPAMSHDDLCRRAKRWLRGTRQCNPVLSNCASVREIPDAIGWSSSYKWYGSTVVECKTSVSDFYADKKKRFAWKHVEHNGYEKIEVPLMGDYRFYMCDSGIISAELVEKHASDHGLLWLAGRSVKVIKEAPKRSLVNKDGEIRFLRFAIINAKEPFSNRKLEIGEPLEATKQ
jgi:hypothetical protein